MHMPIGGCMSHFKIQYWISLSFFCVWKKPHTFTNETWYHNLYYLCIPLYLRVVFLNSVPYMYIQSPQRLFSNQQSSLTYILDSRVLSLTKDSHSQSQLPYSARLHTLYLSFHSISISFSCYSEYLFSRQIKSVYIQSHIKIWLLCIAPESLNLSSGDIVKLKSWNDGQTEPCTYSSRTVYNYTVCMNLFLNSCPYLFSMQWINSKDTFQDFFKKGTRIWIPFTHFLKI